MGTVNLDGEPAMRSNIVAHAGISTYPSKFCNQNVTALERISEVASDSRETPLTIIAD